VAVVGLLVVGLFVWMVGNTGPTEAQRERIEASEREALEPDPALEQLDEGAVLGGLSADAAEGEAPEQAPTTEAPAPEAPAPEEPASSAYEPVDVERFCTGATKIVTFELRLVADMVAQDRDAALRTIAEGTADWEAGVADARAGAPPDNVNDIDDYHQGYLLLFAALRDHATIEDAYQSFGISQLRDLSDAGARLTKQIQFTCS
jgi:hypothetical protein